jgi:hypothetical protein
MRIPSKKHTINNMMIDKLVKISAELDDNGFYDDADIIDNVLIKLAQSVRGEYWIVDGDAEYADGDNGDQNHEMIAEQFMLGQLGYDLDDSGGDTESAQSYDDASRMFTNTLNQNDEYASGDFNKYVEYLKSLNQDDEDYDWTYDAELKDYLLFKNNNSPQAQHVVEGFKDPRTFVIQNHGWIRLEGQHVQLWDLTPATLQSLTSGLYSAYDEDAESVTYHIEIDSKRRYLQAVPLDAIADGSVVKMLRDVDQPVMPAAKPKPLPDDLYSYVGD